MLVDFEAAWLDLKALIAQKSHHGQRDLLAEMARLEVGRRVAEGLPEKALRLYGLEFYSEAIRGEQPDSFGERVPRVDGVKVRALRGDSQHESEEDTHASRYAGAPGGGNGGSRAARG